MAYSCDGRGIYEARSERGAAGGETTVFSRPIASGGGVPPATTTNTSNWSVTCGSTQHFLSVSETGGTCTLAGSSAGSTTGHS